MRSINRQQPKDLSSPVLFFAVGQADSRGRFSPPKLISSTRSGNLRRNSPGLLSSYARPRADGKTCPVHSIKYRELCVDCALPVVCWWYSGDGEGSVGGWNGTYRCPLRRICRFRVPKRVSRYSEASYCKSDSTPRGYTPCSTAPDISLAPPEAVKKKYSNHYSNIIL